VADDICLGPFKYIISLWETSPSRGETMAILDRYRMLAEAE
jgi:hypothetical protein